MNTSWVIILLLLGWLLVFIEVFFIPGTAVLVLIGTITMLCGVVVAFSTFGFLGGTITMILTAIFTLLSIVFGFRLGVMKRLTLRSTLKGKANDEPLNKIKVGDSGTALSKIAPSGKAIFNDLIFEVHSLSLYVEPQTPVEIIKIEHNKIFIQPKLN